MNRYLRESLVNGCVTLSNEIQDAIFIHAREMIAKFCDYVGIYVVMFIMFFCVLTSSVEDVNV